ncbi:MAG: class I adenylate-forming enzyme family protein [Pseudomonadales bacterium]
MSSQPDLHVAIDQLTATGAPFETENANIGGITYKVFKQQPASLRDLFAFIPTHGDSDFLVYQNERLSYNETWNEACAFAHALQTDLGIAKGDRVAIAMRNLPEWVIAFIAITSIGAVVVPMNSWWTKNELAYGLQDSGAKAVVADRTRTDIIQVSEITCIQVREGPFAAGVLNFDGLLARHRSKELPDVVIDCDTDASIMYTPGSTGKPKGAVATHRNILSATTSWALLGTAAKMENGTLDAERDHPPAALLTVPLFHVTGCNSMFLVSVLMGRKIVMMHKWRVEDALELIEKEKITYFSAVPTMSRELQVAAKDTERDISTLEEIFSGGSAWLPKHVKELQETFPAAIFGFGYGLTETSGIATVNTNAHYSKGPASAGKVMPAVTELKIITPDGNELPVNQPGEVCIKSSANVRCYWNKSEATAAAFHNGWFHTGDVGYLDEEGYLYIVDRSKDIIIRGGKNISCIEVEATLYQHSAVAEAAVFGVPDERLGEVVFAVVVARNKEELEAEQLKSFAAKRIAAFKVPEHISVIHESLPRTGTGKIFKSQIRDVVVKNFTSAA